MVSTAGQAKKIDQTDPPKNTPMFSMTISIQPDRPSERPAERPATDPPEYVEVLDVDETLDEECVTPPIDSASEDEVEDGYASGPTTSPQKNQSVPTEEFSDSDDEDSKPRLNQPADLRQGIVRTTAHKKELTILLVGETGVGKTCFLSLLANVLAGHTPEQYTDFYASDNERGGSQSQSQTQVAKVYKFESKNGITIRILDTPGLADTRGIAQDEKHKASIAKSIQNHIAVVNSVLILANGTVPRLGAATDYALTTLSSIFPRTLSDNIALLFTNVGNMGAFNFDPTSLPDEMKKAEEFLLDNPVAIQKKFVSMREKNYSKKLLKEVRNSVIQGETKAIEMLSELFDWMDGRMAQPTKDILSLYEQSQEIEKSIQNTLARMQQANEKKNDLEKLKRRAESANSAMRLYEDFEYIMKKRVHIQAAKNYHSTLCSKPDCYSNCHKHCQLSFSLDPSNLSGCAAMNENGIVCKICGHHRDDHRHYNSQWKLQEEDEKVVDQESKRKYHDAKSEKEAIEALIKGMQRAIDKFANTVEDATAEVASLTESYASLSLSGSFSSQVYKSIKLLELNIEKMQNDGSSPDMIKILQDSLASMQQKVQVLNAAKQARKSRRLRTDRLRSDNNSAIGGDGSRNTNPLRSFWSSLGI